MFEKLMEMEISLQSPVFWIGIYVGLMLANFKKVRGITESWDKPTDAVVAFILAVLAVIVFATSPIWRSLGFVLGTFSKFVRKIFRI